SKSNKSTNFAPPRGGKVRFSEEVRVKKVKARGKNLPLDLMDNDEAQNDDDLMDSGEENEGGVELEPYDDGIGAEVDMDADRGDEDSDEISMENGSRDAINRLQTDLFADDTEEE